MSSQISLSRARLVVVIAALSIGGVPLITPLWQSRVSDAAAVYHKVSVALPTLQSPPQRTVRQINLHTNDLVVDPNSENL